MVPEWLRRSRPWGLVASKVSRQGCGHHVPPDRSPSQSGYHCVLWFSRCTGKRCVCGCVCEGKRWAIFTFIHLEGELGLTLLVVS